MMQRKLASLFLVAVLLCLTGCFGPGKGTLQITNKTKGVLKVSYDGPIYGFVNVKPNSSARVRIVVGDYVVHANKANDPHKYGMQAARVGGLGAHVIFGGKARKKP